MIPLGALLYAATLCVPVCIAYPRQATEIMAQIDAARQLLSLEAQQVGFQAGGYLNFEEDCDASVALRELMDSGIIAPRTDNYFRPGEYEAALTGACSAGTRLIGVHGRNGSLYRRQKRQRSVNGNGLCNQDHDPGRAQLLLYRQPATRQAGRLHRSFARGHGQKRQRLFSPHGRIIAGS